MGRTAESGQCYDCRRFVYRRCNYLSSGVLMVLRRPCAALLTWLLDLGSKVVRPEYQGGFIAE